MDATREQGAQKLTRMGKRLQKFITIKTHRVTVQEVLYSFDSHLVIVQLTLRKKNFLGNQQVG